MTLAALLDRPGRAAIPFAFDGQPERAITLHTHRAAGHRPGGEAVLVLHGMLRNGDAYRDFWVEAAERHDLLIVAPTFSAEAFPGPEGYNNGVVLDEEGRATARETWAYHVPSRVAGALVGAGVAAEGRLRLFGHSAGAQFAHRMASLVGFGPFRSVIAANAGWYSLPSLEARFPAGLGGIGLGAEDLRRLLAAELWGLAGTEDAAADAENLPSGPDAQAQGPGRLHRARNYLEQGRLAAEALGAPFGWRLTEVPGVGHDGAAMGRAAAGLWFEGALPPAGALGARAASINA